LFRAAPYEQQVVMLEEHKREVERRRQLRRQEPQERAAQADTRAEQLVKMVIPAEEFTRWENSREIRVTGSEGGVYVIRCNTHEGNVDWYDNGERVGSFCAHPRMGFSNGNKLPLADAITAQYLALVHDEWQFIATANVYNIYATAGNTAAERMHARRNQAREVITARRAAEPAEPQRINAMIAA